ncbi:hypothetical protein Q427_06460 [Halomonas sp. BC04]|nr:hypothetical protein Q427_06460 [Halomonas sp. BC04]
MGQWLAVGFCQMGQRQAGAENHQGGNARRVVVGE